MKLVFLGTRGFIGPRKRRHRMHAATLVAYRGRRVMIDCGETWRGRVEGVAPHAIVLTHAHPDHASGLDRGSPCPVWASGETWEAIDRFPIAARRRRTLVPREPRRIEGISFEAFPVVHSVRAPAVGYRIGAGRVTLFYVPDVVRIRDRAEALRGARLYVGDGATIERSMVRRPGGAGEPIGHATIREQLRWCRAEGVPEMIVTHLGSDVVGRDERTVGPRIRALGRAAGVEVTLAFDGMVRVVR